jgi:hypothetical protein
VGLHSAKEAIQNFKGNVDKEYNSKIIVENIVGQVSFAIDHENKEKCTDSELYLPYIRLNMLICSISKTNNVLQSIDRCSILMTC